MERNELRGSKVLPRLRVPTTEAPFESILGMKVWNSLNPPAVPAAQKPWIQKNTKARGHALGPLQALLLSSCQDNAEIEHQCSL